MDLAEKRRVLESYSWIEVAPYADDDTQSWEDRYRALEKHHVSETEFLIGKIRELVKKLHGAD